MRGERGEIGPFGSSFSWLLKTFPQGVCWWLFVLPSETHVHTHRHTRKHTLFRSLPGAFQLTFSLALLSWLLSLKVRLQLLSVGITCPSGRQPSWVGSLQGDAKLLLPSALSTWPTGQVMKPFPTKHWKWRLLPLSSCLLPSGAAPGSPCLYHTCPRLS